MSRTRRPFLKLFFAACAVGLLVVVYLDVRITATFTDKMWEVPAKVYARPLELFPGLILAVDELEHELELLGYRDAANPGSVGQKHVADERVELYTRGFNFADESVAPQRISLRFAGDRLLQLSSGGKRVELLRLEPVQIGGIYPQHREDRLLLRLEEVPLILRSAL
ncbi:MAG: penicillin-binding protein 1B, partial [Haliea sp.]|nr:penicillin-binding protein 1B [Haliea sp.]